MHRFLAKGLLPRVSRLSGNDKGDNGVKPGSCLTSEENPGKLQLGDCLMKAVGPVISSNGIP